MMVHLHSCTPELQLYKYSYEGGGKVTIISSFIRFEEEYVEKFYLKYS